MAHKQTLTIEFDAVDYPTLLDFFNKFQVKIKSKKHLTNSDTTTTTGKESNLPETKTPKFGFMKGRFKMSADFDAPLEDFKDYM